jgi:TonB family protein
VSVDADGHITDCRILTSSGSPILDQGTCDLVRKRGQFNPATDEKGKRVAGTYSLATRWVLQDNAKLIPLDQPWHIASTISVDSVGKVLSCKEETSQPGVWTPYPCFSVNTLPVWYAMYTRTGVSGTAPIDVTFEAGIAASGATPPGMLAAKPGRTVLATIVMRLDIGADGAVTGCKVIKDSGTSGWADPCKRKVGPFAPSAKPSVMDITLNVSRAGG